METDEEAPHYFYLVEIYYNDGQLRSKVSGTMQSNLQGYQLYNTAKLLGTEEYERRNGGTVKYSSLVGLNRL